MSKKKNLKLSDFYIGLLTGEMNLEQRFLLAKIIKTIAIEKDAIVPFWFESENYQIDLNKKESRTNF